MIKSIKFYLLILIISIISVFPINAKEDKALKNTPLQPFLNGTEELKTLKYDKAIKWFNITCKDFKDSEFAVKAKYLKLIILLSRELAYLRLFNNFTNGKNNILEVNMKLAKKKQNEFDRDIKEFKDKLDELAPLILEESKEFLTLSKITSSIEMSFSIDISDWDATTEKNLVRNGSVITQRQKEKLVSREILKNFLGFLSKVFDFLPDRDKLNTISGKFNRLEFFTTLGIRLYNIGTYRADQKYLDQAKLVLEKSLEISKDDKYNKIRIAAQDYLEKLKVKTGDSSKNDLICKKCKKTHPDTFKFCPDCGGKLEKIKKK